MDYVLQTKNLTKKYGHFSAVDNVTMNIPKGEIYGFVGENGAGKTTIIRLITNVVNATSGEFSLFGVSKNDKKIDLERRRMSAVVEGPSIYLNLSAYDNLLAQAKLLGIVDLTRIDKVLEMVGLSYVADSKKKAKDFSLGMRQRLGLAVALLGHPDFLVLDEPMNGLDPEGIVEVRELILKLNKELGITILMSSHILSELGKIATCYGFITHGKLIKEISAKELENNCKHCIQLTFENLDGVIDVIENGIKAKDYKVISDKSIRIFDKIDAASIILAFAKKNINVKGIETLNENIEEFYLDLIGGGKHA